MRTLFCSNGYLLPSVEPFLQAIREQPDEDLHRLVLADFLQERGDADRGDEAHAALIQLQCERARAEPWGLSDESLWLPAEERRLLGEIDDPLTWPGPSCVCFDRFVRGLPTAIRVSAPWRLRGAGPALAVGTADTLILQRLGDVRELARHLRVLPITRLDLNVGPGVLPALLAGRGLPAVRGWVLTGCLDRNDLMTLWGAVRSGRAEVEELDLSWVDHGPMPEFVTELARCMRAGVLGLSYNVEAGRVVQDLTAPPHPRDRGLRRLVANYALLGDDELRAIAGWPGATHLEYLSVESYGDGDGPGDDGVEALLGSPYLAGLRVLLLSGSQMTDRGAAALAGAPAGWDLRRIDLLRTQVTPAGIAAIRARFPECRVDAPRWDIS